jgi:hypothetical protein
MSGFPVIQESASAARAKQPVPWHRLSLQLSVAIFALALGLFLFVFPWLQSWDANWVAAQSPRLWEIWNSRYFRGALSGLGLLNIYIALTELWSNLQSLLRDKPK